MHRFMMIAIATLLAVNTPPEVVGAAAETAGAVLARLHKLPPDQRQKTLIDRAKAEGEVAFYSSL